MPFALRTRPQILRDLTYWTRVRRSCRSRSDNPSWLNEANRHLDVLLDELLTQEDSRG